MALTGPARSAQRDLVSVDPVVDRRVVEIREERVDVGRAVGLVVEEVRVLVDVQRDERRRIPDRIRVLRVADVVEEATLVPVVRRPRPPAARHAGRLEVLAPARHRAEVTLDELPERAVRLSAVPAQMLEVDLVVLDAPDGEGQRDLQRADLRVDLVAGRQIDVGELGEDLVPLADVALVELVVRLDGLARDAVQLVEARLQLARRDLLVVEYKRRQRGTPWT